MKLSLIVLTPGRWEGKVIAITRTPFLIGRDQECHLRPASDIISKRHCALMIANEKAFLHDFDSTNGTFLNDRQIKGEIELLNGDRLKVGALEFAVRMETRARVDEPTPFPPTRGATADIAPDELAATVLLSGGDTPPALPASAVDAHGVPTGDTEIMGQAEATKETAPAADTPAKAGANETKGKAASGGDTSTAAKAILERYIRRPRHKVE
jgi:pSer/pThr/pTyr-binding forkhead associated (FHA) protein